MILRDVNVLVQFGSARGVAIGHCGAMSAASAAHSSSMVCRRRVHFNGDLLPQANLGDHFFSPEQRVFVITACSSATTVA